MDHSTKPTPIRPKSKLAKTFQKVKNLKNNSKTHSNNPFCLLLPHDKFKNGDCYSTPRDDNSFKKHRAAMEAFIAELFATISSIKAAYAELQMAQFPYNSDAIQTSDQAVVVELKALSELKYKFMKRDINYSTPHVTILLAEIQEQQNLMKMYEITMNKMERDIKEKEAKINSLRDELNMAIGKNKSHEIKLNSSGCFSIFDNVNLSNLHPNDFILVLHYTVRSIRSFVKQLIREMENANWDIDLATNAIEPNSAFPEKSHRCFAIEAFICREMFDGFNDSNFHLPNSAIPGEGDHDGGNSSFHFHQFKKMKSANTNSFLKQNPNSTFGKFTRAKFLRLVHPKMEASFFGNLNQRKMIKSSTEFPGTSFFSSFAEMARRIWVLHSLAFCFEDGVCIFQVGKNHRFSEVYMESVVFSVTGGDGRVAFTVVPGFKIGKTVVQSQVYLYPANNN